MQGQLRDNCPRTQVWKGEEALSSRETRCCEPRSQVGPPASGGKESLETVITLTHQRIKGNLSKMC